MLPAGWSQNKGDKGAPKGSHSANGAGNASWVEEFPACLSTLLVRGWQVLAAGRGSTMEPRWQYQFRVIMLGDSTVGKSSLLRRYTEGVFLDAVNQTVGVDFYVQFVELEPGLQVKLQFWDTAGQERFRWVHVVGRGGGDGCPPPDLGWNVVIPSPGRSSMRLCSHWSLWVRNHRAKSRSQGKGALGTAL